MPSFNPERVADALSRERLSKYLARSRGDLQLALALYVWNQEVGAALTVVLSQVEICLRNRVAEALANAFGAGWTRDARLRHNHHEVLKELEKAESRLKKAAPSVGDIVAAYDFNLWRELCKPIYAGVFWAKRVPLAFPNQGSLHGLLKTARQGLCMNELPFEQVLKEDFATAIARFGVADGLPSTYLRL